MAVAGFDRLPLLLAAALVAGCTSVRSAPVSFEGPSWQVVQINGASVPSTHLYQLRFNDGRISGRFGCNQFSGTYAIKEERMVARDIASTLIGCPEPAASHEAQGFLTLAKPMKVDWESGDRVTLTNENGTIVLNRTAGP